MDVVVIYKQDVNSWIAARTFAAIAKDMDSAIRWVQDEIDGKHKGSEDSYSKGKTAEWWINAGFFSLKSEPVYE